MFKAENYKVICVNSNTHNYAEWKLQEKELIPYRYFDDKGYVLVPY